ncbi:hypothetical protein ACGC1H_004766 [Rhizoctonia solani]
MYPSCRFGLRLGPALVAQCRSRVYLRPVGGLATNEARNLTHMRALFSVRSVESMKASKHSGDSPSQAPAHIQKQLNSRRRSKPPSTRSTSSKLRVKPKWTRHKQPRPKPTPPSPVEPILQTLAQKIAHFQTKLLEIRGNKNNQITKLDDVARSIGVEGDRLHPLVHCKYILQIDTSSILQELLQAIADKSPDGQKHTTQLDSTAIWLESRILAVQLWVIKRLLLRMEPGTMGGALHTQAWSSIQDIETQISEMCLVVATLRGIFHRVRSDSAGRSPQEGWAKNIFIKEDVEGDMDGPSLVPATQSPGAVHSQRNPTGALVSHSILLENLAVIAAYSRQESVIWKIERFLSRIEEVHHRVSRAISLLDQLAQDLQVTGDRTHPVVSCKHVLQLDSFSSLDMVLRILRKRTPKSRIELDQGMGEALWLDSRLPEVQLEVVKMRLWAFHLIMKSQNLPPQQKNLIRSIRGRIKVAHRLLRNSREEFGSYGPQGKFEIDDDVSNERKDDIHSHGGLVDEKRS